MSNNLLTNVRFYNVKSSTGSIKANGKVTVAGVFDIAFRVLEGQKGPWIAWPGRFGDKPGENGKKPWYSDVTVIDDGAREDINQTLLTEYANQGSDSYKSSTKPKTGYPAPDKTKPADDGCPF